MFQCVYWSIFLILFNLDKMMIFFIIKKNAMSIMTVGVKTLYISFVLLISLDFGQLIFGNMYCTPEFIMPRTAYGPRFGLESTEYDN